MQRVRDEAHRFAITSHRSQRRKKGMASRLETIPGVGPKRRKVLLKHFENSIDAIKGASVAELSAVTGISKEVALNIKEPPGLTCEGSAKYGGHGSRRSLCRGDFVSRPNSEIALVGDSQSRPYISFVRRALSIKIDTPLARGNLTQRGA